MVDISVIGVDIGGTNTKFAIVNSKGIVRHFESISTKPEDLPSKLVDRIFDSISTSIDPTVAGIGIGAPNANSRKGTVEYPPNLSWGGVTHLSALFEERFSLPAFLSNDADCAAIGEMYFGAAKGMSDFIAITIGTGLGSGVVVDGKLVYGYTGFAGELGHTVVARDGRVCGCGKRGCLETYVSAGGICRTVLERLASSDISSSLRDISGETLTTEDIFVAASRGDKLALEVIDYTADLLAMKLADAAALTSPEAIIISGGVAKGGELLLAPVRGYLERYLFPQLRGSIKVIRSQADESSAGAVGAAALALTELAG